MSDGIFLLNADDRLIQMTSQPYDSESLLQELLAKYPSLLAGEQLDPESPRRWLFIERESSIPGEQDGAGRWSLDHLFVDQEGIPTLIEVKRSTDTRIRREVVGQMLDYAANAVLYWPAEAIRLRFEQSCEQAGVDPQQRLAEALGDEIEVERFWTDVKTNLQAGRIRLLFVADRVPDELRRVVEFLNQQMDPAEVLAVEIKQYVGEGMKTLVPRVMGMTSAAQSKKHPRVNRSGSQWDEKRYFDTLRTIKGEAEAALARRIYDFAAEKFETPDFGRGSDYGTLSVIIHHDGQRHVLCDIGTPSITSPTAKTKPTNVAIRFNRLLEFTNFRDEALREQLRTRLNAIPGVQLPADAIDRHPNFPLHLLAAESSMVQFLEILAWMNETIRDGDV